MSQISKKTEGCWEWTGCLTKHGYGQISKNGKPSRAHRVSYELYIEEIPTGLHVCHHCDNRKCVNPQHLFLGTNQENIQDKMNKGRHVKGEMINHSKLNEEQVLDAIQLYKNGNTPASIARKYGISERGISKIFNGKSWKHLNVDIPKKQTNFREVKYFDCPNCNKKGLHLYSASQDEEYYECKFCHKMEKSLISKANQQTK